MQSIERALLKFHPTAGWFCSFKPGARVVGCYAHIVSVLWYLGFEWLQPARESSMAHNLYMDSLTDAAAEVWKSIKDSSD